MLIKINGKKLHLASFEVVPTAHVLKRCLDIQKEIAKMQLSLKQIKEDDPESIIKSLEAQTRWLDSYTDFLQDVLKLSESQVKKVEDSDFDDVTEFTGEVGDKTLQRDNSKSDSK